MKLLKFIRTINRHSIKIKSNKKTEAEETFEKILLFGEKKYQKEKTFKEASDSVLDTILLNKKNKISNYFIENNKNFGFITNKYKGSSLFKSQFSNYKLIKKIINSKYDKAKDNDKAFNYKLSVFDLVIFLLLVRFFYKVEDIYENALSILINQNFLYKDYRLDDETIFFDNAEKELNQSNPEADLLDLSNLSNKSNSNEANSAFNIIQPFTNNEFQIANNIKDRLEDVKGIDEIKDEIGDIVKMLKNPSAYEEAGAKLVKGILLMGKPGTGKTLLARALAGESSVNYIYCNGADFDKTFIGQGNRVIKNLFKQARANQPCIIFIDEIDSLLHKGRREGKYSSSNDRALINTFLSEMDGFRKREYIFVLGATNSEKDLDKAAIRPGRFDKLITVPLPDSKGREDIFKLYINKIQIKISDDVSIGYLSKLTPGFSGAEIENMVNNAVIDAVDKDLSLMTKEVFEESRDRVLTGIKRKVNKQTLNRLIQTAVHESGHALACYLDEICKENIHKVTIIPRGTSSSKSYTLSNDSIQGTKEEMYSFIDKSLGGIFAEEIFFDDKNKIGSGCEGGDLERATSLAKSMIKNYGMKGSEFGLQVINDSNYIVDHKISQETRDELDKVVLSVINERSAIVKKKLKENSHLLKLLTKNLIQYEELTKEDIEKIFSGKDLHKQIKNQEVLNYMEMNEKKKVI